MNTTRFIIAVLIVGKLLFVSHPVQAQPKPKQSDESKADKEKEDEEDEENEDLRLAVNTENDGTDVLAKNNPEAVSKNDPESVAKSDPEAVSKNDPDAVAKSEQEAVSKNEQEAVAKSEQEAMAAMDPDKDLAINYRRSEEEKAKAFMKAFGIEMPTIFYPHEMKVILDRNITVVMIVDINPYSEEVVFRTDNLMPFLQEYLLLDPLNEHFGFDLPETIDEEFLRQKGFSIDIEMKYQNIDLTSPVELRQKQDIFVSSSARRVLSLQSPTGPQPISGYVNMTHDLNVGADTLMYNGNYRGNVNVEDWVVQSELTYNTLAEQRTIISGGRVIKDFEKEGLRLTLGDNGSPNLRTGLQRPPLVSGFQQTLFGVDVSHTIGLVGPRSRPDDFSHVVVVPEDARVEININGRKVYSRLLLSGKYELHDLPFQTGRNNVAILVVGREGVLSESEFEYFYNPSLLAKGQREFQGTLGMPYKGASNIAQIDDQRLAGLVYTRYGFTNHIGGTAYVQAVQNKIVAGGIGEYAFESNVVSTELAYSNNAQGTSGSALNLQVYSSNAAYLTQNIKILPSFYSLSLLHMSRYFDPTLLEGFVGNETRLVLAPSMFWPVNPYSQVQLTATIQNQYMGDNIQAYRIRTFYQIDGWQFTASLEQRLNPQENELIFQTNIVWRPSRNPRNRYNYRYISSSDQHIFAANVRPEDNNAINYQWTSSVVDQNNNSHFGLVQYQTMGSNMAGTINITGSSYGVSAGEVGFNYFGPRACIDIAHARRSTGLNTSVNLNTALAFVGKHWGVSQPIRNSFAILYPNNEAMTDSKIIFNGGSVLDRYSAAVYPALNNHQAIELKIDATNVPLGLDLGSQKYLLQSSLNSGQAVPVGKAGGITIAQATLLNAAGKPVERDVGYFIYVEDPSMKIQFFTNSSGRLFVQGLKSGGYTIEMLGERYEPIVVTIPKGVESPYQLGDLTLTLQEKKSEEPDEESKDALVDPPEDNFESTE